MKISREQLNQIIVEELNASVESGEITQEELEALQEGPLDFVKDVGKGITTGAKSGWQAFKTSRQARLNKQNNPQQAGTAPAAAQQRTQPQVTKTNFTQGPSSSPAPTAQPAAAGQQAQPAQTPAAAQPETPPAAAQQPVAPKDAVADSTADIVMPHAVVLKGLLTKQIAQSLQKVLGGLPQDQRKTVMTPVMQYINNLPGMASKVISEEISPEQQALKAKLAAKHAGNISLIGKNLQALEGEIMNSIKSQLNIDNIPNLLFQAIEKAYGNTKEGLQYMKSLQKNPQGHLNSLLQNAQLVVKNIMSLVQKNMPKAPEGQEKLGTPQKPGANAAVMTKKPGAPVKPSTAPVQESYKTIYDKWQKIIKG